MPAANVDIGRPEDSFMRRTRTVSPADLGQAFDRVALGKSDYFNHYKQYRIDELTAASLPPKQQDAQIQDSIEIICRYAYQSGLSIPTLTATLEIVIGSKSLSRSNRAMLIKSLYPAGEVPSRLICIAVASLGQGKQKLSVSLQQSLLKWIILVYEVLEDPSVLSRLYSVLFNMLDVTSLRPTLCHVLAMITRRKHIKPFRIQLLSDLSKRVAREPALTGFMKVYEEHYPEAFSGEKLAGRTFSFSHPNLDWRNRLHKIQKANGRSLRNADINLHIFRSVRKGSKRIHVHNDLEEQPNLCEKSSKTLGDLNDIQDLVKNLDDIYISAERMLILDDPLLQKYIALRPNDDARRLRLERQLEVFLDEQLEKIDSSLNTSHELSDILGRLSSYIRYTKTIPKPAIIFFERYLLKWNGRDNQEEILHILSHVDIQPFEDLQSSLLNPLEDALLDNTPSSALALLYFYTSLLRHWTAHLLATNEPPSPNPITSLTAHTSLLTLTLLTSYPSSLTTISTILTHFETLAHSISNPSIPITTPHPQTIYLLTFLSPTLSTLSRLCAILATYKLAFEAAMAAPSQQQQQQHQEPYPRGDVAHFNGFLMDICNLLWRSRAFNTTDAHALGCLLPAPTLSALTTYAHAHSYSLPTLFSLSHNPTLAALSIAAFRDMEDAQADGGVVMIRHAGPVSQKSLARLREEGRVKVGWAEYRMGVLRWLAARGVRGVGELMGVTMKQLMNGEGKGLGGV